MPELIYTDQFLQNRQIMSGGGVEELNLVIVLTRSLV